MACAASFAASADDLAEISPGDGITPVPTIPDPKFARDRAGSGENKVPSRVAGPPDCEVDSRVTVARRAVTGREQAGDVEILRREDDRSPRRARCPRMLP